MNYLYKTTNKINGKIYVGVHTTSDLNDGYLGSGKVLKKAIEKYGEENFDKEIIELFETKEEMFLREKEVVDKDFLDRDDVYNLVEGGRRSWPDWATQKGRKTQYDNELGIFSQDSRKKVLDFHLSDAGIEQRKKAFESSLKESSRKKRVETFRKIDHQKGIKNSQHGTMWITDGTINKKIKKDSDLPNGFRKGRV